VDLKHRLSNIETDCRDRMHGSLPHHRDHPSGGRFNGTYAPVREPSTASGTDIVAGGLFELDSGNCRFRAVSQYVARPPERSNTAPALNVHESEQSHSTSSATSLAVPSRLKVVRDTMAAIASGENWRIISVSQAAGATALTRMSVSAVPYPATL
jgi:hypothetical protein